MRIWWLYEDILMDPNNSKVLLRAKTCFYNQVLVRVWLLAVMVKVSVRGSGMWCKTTETWPGHDQCGQTPVKFCQE